jgi:hypothetical protein
MNTGVVIVVGIMTTGVATMVGAKILEASGKADYAMFADIAGKSIVIVTSLGCFAKVVKTLVSLG